MTLKDRLLENTDVLLQEMNSFPDDLFHIKPDDNSWSAADILEHLYRSEFGLTRLFNGVTAPLKDRNPDAYVHEIKLRMQDPSIKKSFGVINPTGNFKSKEELITKFRSNRNAVAELISIQNVNELCLEFENPLFGHLTRLEWIHFSMFHTNRHLIQLKRIQNHFQA